MNIEFSKYKDGLAPAVVQDATTGAVLMLGFMNAAALDETRKTGLVTFFSRSKQRLWTKGEESGNVLRVVEILADCDQDTLLVKATPAGPVCHTGADTCFGGKNVQPVLSRLEGVIRDRRNTMQEASYVSGLFSKGINKIAQKVGEEAVELVIESKDANDALFLGEAADLLFHYLILLQAKGFELADVLRILEQREKAR